jgi:hypothetical protein
MIQALFARRTMIFHHTNHALKKRFHMMEMYRHFSALYVLRCTSKVQSRCGGNPAQSSQ